MDCLIIRKIKTYIKIALPWYICLPVIIFSFMFPILFGCDTYEDVGIISDRCFSFLSVIVFSNVYHIELQQRTFEVYNLLPNSKKRSDILIRLLVRFFFTTFMIGICFLGYEIKGLHSYVDKDAGFLFFQAFFSVMAVMFLFGSISFFFVNISCNMKIGIGAGILIWMIVTSTLASKVPVLTNIFTYCVRDDWLTGKVAAIFAGMIFFFMGTLVINKKGSR